MYKSLCINVLQTDSILYLKHQRHFIEMHPDQWIRISMTLLHYLAKCNMRFDLK